MNKLMTAVLGLSLTLGSAGVMLAAQTDKTAPADTQSTTTPKATKVKKHHKHTKKSAMETAKPAASQPPAVNPAK